MVEVVRLQVDASKILFYALRAANSDGSVLELLLEIVEKDGKKYLVGNSAQGVFETFEEEKEETPKDI